MGNSLNFAKHIYSHLLRLTVVRPLVTGEFKDIEGLPNMQEAGASNICLV